MSEATQRPNPYPELIQSTPIEVGGKILQPVVRVQGWQSLGDAGGGAFLRLSPHAVHVQVGDKTDTLPMIDPDQAPLRMLFYLSAAVTGVCLLLMLLVFGVTRRR